jgi:hypothetical protein
MSTLKITVILSEVRRQPNEVERPHILSDNTWPCNLSTTHLWMRSLEGEPCGPKARSLQASQ